MSTNAIVATGTPAQFEGRYVHWDGYPDTTGKALWEILQVDDEAVQRLLKLLSDHAAGWSSFPSECYCHDRGEGLESAQTLTEGDAGEFPYTYIVNPLDHTLTILTGGLGHSRVFDYRGDAPDWKALSQ
jgi:hypothetical protein